MNKKTIIIIVSIVCSLLLLGGGITGVVLLTGDNDPTSTKLDTMTVTLTENVASWETCEKAEKYEISINGALSYLENSVTSYTLKKGETFKIRAVGDGTNYLTSDWSNQVTYDTEETYTIIWKNGDTILYVDSNALEGTLPEYGGPTPTKPSTNGISYKFKGWTPEVSIVTKDETYYAVFEETLNTYTVTWKNEDTVLEIDEFVEYGETPEYNGNIPTKEANETYTYTFIGWDKEISKVTSDVTYTAKFKEEKVLYKVTFYNEDGSKIYDEVFVEYGGTASYTKSTPKKESEGNEVYIFDMWVINIGSAEEATLANIKQNTSVYAKFTTNLIYYTVTFHDITGVAVKTEKVLRGEAATAPELSDNITGRAFKGWDTKFDDVTSDLKVYPVYVNLYTVEFFDINNTLISFYEVEETSTNSTFNEVAPTVNGYQFYGWLGSNGEIYSESISLKITSSMTFTAKYKKLYTVSFFDIDSKLIKEFSNIVEGTSITPPNAPEIEGYTFTGWDNEVPNVINSDMEFFAKYKLNTYEVTFVLPDDTKITQEVVYGNPAVPPTDIKEVYFSWKTYKAYEFDGWDKDFNSIKENTIINSLTKEILQPVLIAENKNINSNISTVTLSVYLYCQNITMQGLNLNLSLNPSLSVNIENDNYDITINNTLKNYSNSLNQETNEFKLSCLDKITFTSGNASMQIVQITFDLSNELKDGYYELSIQEGSCLIITNKDNQYEYVTIKPILISGGINVVSGVNKDA